MERRLCRRGWLGERPARAFSALADAGDWESGRPGVLCSARRGRPLHWPARVAGRAAGPGVLCTGRRLWLGERQAQDVPCSGRRGWGRAAGAGDFCSGRRGWLADEEGTGGDPCSAATAGGYGRGRRSGASSGGAESTGRGEPCGGK